MDAVVHFICVSLVAHSVFFSLCRFHTGLQFVKGGKWINCFICLTGLSGLWNKFVDTYYQ